MPDRFSQDSPSDLMRNFNRARYGRMEEDCQCIFRGDSVDSRWCELHSWDAGDEHAGAQCSSRQRIVEFSDSVTELAEALKKHERECPVCGGGEEIQLPEAA